jgi:hypothetical protein
MSDNQSSAVIAELEHQRAWALTRCAVLAAELNKALLEIETLKKQNAGNTDTSVISQE